MKNKILLFIAIVMLIVYGMIRSFNNKTSFFSPQIRIKDTSTGEIITINMENYIIGVVAGEMPASFNAEALKAQAIASRTYAYYKMKRTNGVYDVTNDTSSQVYLTEQQMKNKWKDDYDLYFNKIKAAVDATQQLVLAYNNEIIPAYYFAMSNGYTENVSAVFGESEKCLVSVLSPEDTSHRNYEVTTTFDTLDLLSKLDLNAENMEVTNVIRNESHRVESVSINNKVFSGIEVRKLLGLRSTDFTFDVADNTVDITTLGYGHGVGMSQYGANTMARSGATYDKILLHYYKGASIKNIQSIK